LAPAAHTSLAPPSLQRQEPRSKNVNIDILFCSACHSDLYTARNGWDGPPYSVVPCHEIIERVVSTGQAASRYRVCDLVGVDFFLDTCRAWEVSYCEGGINWTYNSPDKEYGVPISGCYSSHILADEQYLLHISENLAPDRAGCLIGGTRETKEMLDYSGQHDISCEVDIIPNSYINEAYERMLHRDVRCRFVIDMSSIKQA